MTHYHIKSLVLGASLAFAATLWAEDVTLTTYYPSPRGVYNELETRELETRVITLDNEPFGAMPDISRTNDPPADAVITTKEMGGFLNLRGKLRVTNPQGDVDILTTYIGGITIDTTQLPGVAGVVTIQGTDVNFSGNAVSLDGTTLDITSNELDITSPQIDLFGTLDLFVDAARTDPYLTLEPLSTAGPQFGGKLTVRRKLQFWSTDASGNNELVAELTRNTYDDAVLRFESPLLLGDGDPTVPPPAGLRYPELVIRRPPQAVSFGPHMFIGLGVDWPRVFPAPVGLYIKGSGPVHGFGIYIENDSPTGTGDGIHVVSSSNDPGASAIEALSNNAVSPQSGPTISASRENQTTTNAGLVGLFRGGIGVEVSPHGTQIVDPATGASPLPPNGQGGNVYANDFYINRIDTWASQISGGGGPGGPAFRCVFSVKGGGLLTGDAKCSAIHPDAKCLYILDCNNTNPAVSCNGSGNTTIVTSRPCEESFTFPTDYVAKCCGNF